MEKNNQNTFRASNSFKTKKVYEKHMAGLNFFLYLENHFSLKQCKTR